MKTIMIKGPIISNGEKWIYEWFEEDSTCPNDVIKALPDDNSEVTIIINSGGGYVNCGNEIYTALKSYAGRVIVEIIEAASAASVIAMAGDIIRITPVGNIMIHNASCITSGDYHAIDKTSEILQKTNQSISNAYQLKTGLSQEKLLAMMDKETWMTAEEAKENGFVDEILFQEEEEMILVANCKELLPQNIISTMQKWKNGESSLQSMISQEVEKAMKQINENKSESMREPEKQRNRFFFI